MLMFTAMFAIVEGGNALNIFNGVLLAGVKVASIMMILYLGMALVMITFAWVMSQMESNK